VRERLSPEEFCPAASQGALGIETRKDDAATIDAVSFLDHAVTRFAVAVERAALAALGGGCQVPIGIHCRQVPFEALKVKAKSDCTMRSLASLPVQTLARLCASIIEACATTLIQQRSAVRLPQC